MTVCDYTTQFVRHAAGVSAATLNLEALVPIFEFACDACGKSFEQLLRTAADRGKIVCPLCGANRVSKQPSVFAAHDAPVPTRGLPTGGCGRCGDPNGPCSIE